MSDFFDAVVVGAGLSGATCAERLAAAGRSVLVIEQRGTAGGNCYDERDERGILVHRYGPHLFHTDDARVFRYLSRFAAWEPYEHRVRAMIDGQAVPLPFSLVTLHALFPAPMAERMEAALLAQFPWGTRMPILELAKSSDENLRKLAAFVYEKVFLHYTEKQWGRRPEEIDGAVTARVPVFVGRDDRYFYDRFQGVPRAGYAQMIRQMLAHPRIHLLLQTPAREALSLRDGRVMLWGQPFLGPVIYTGMVDELFGFSHGELPYRSVRMEFVAAPAAPQQAAPTVNYPNAYDFTRITDFQQIHPAAGAHAMTTLLREYPQAYRRGENLAYYPVFTEEARAAYARYAEDAEAYPQLHLVGRLAEYRYYDMDDAVRRALDVMTSLGAELGA